MKKYEEFFFEMVAFQADVIRTSSVTDMEWSKGDDFGNDEFDEL